MMAAPPPNPEGLPAPLIFLPTLTNLRDIGGYPLPSPPHQPNAHVRKGLLYRSASPHSCSDEDLAILHDTLGIRTVFDLRSTPEVVRSGGSDALDQKLDAAGMRRVWAPVFADEDYSPEKIALRFQYYGSEGSEVRVV